MTKEDYLELTTQVCPRLLKICLHKSLAINDVSVVTLKDYFVLLNSRLC